MEREGDEPVNYCGSVIEDTFNALQGAGYCSIPIMISAITAVGAMAGQISCQVADKDGFGDMRAEFIATFDRAFTDGVAKFRSNGEQQHAH